MTSAAEDTILWQRDFAAHMRVALTGALLLAMCQVVTETVVVAVHLRDSLLSPSTLPDTQMYDFCVKVFGLLPNSSGWFAEGGLDRFLAVGFRPKLVLLSALVAPNLAVAAALGLLAGVVRYFLRLPARIISIVLALVLCGVVVHGVSFALAVHIPKAWSAAVIVRNAGRVLVWEQAGVALIVLMVAGVLAAAIGRLNPLARWLVLSATATVAVVALLLSVPPSPAALVTSVERSRAGDSGVAPGPVENVLLVSIDSLRADRLGCYGNERNTSPNIDRLAREGVRFSDTMSTTSWTLPSHMSLLTGRYLLRHGVITENDSLPDGVPTLAGTLQRAGVRTGGIVSALLLKSDYGFGRGFDYYDDRTIVPATWQEELRAESAPEVTDLTVKWLREHRGRRFFLFVHFWDVHYDYVPPQPFDTMFDPDYRGSVNGVNFYHNSAVRRGMPQRDLRHILALYDGEIRWVDDHLGRILAAVNELAIADSTAVIVTADHGDEFFEHGFKGHQRTLYREVMHVPLIMRIPGSTVGGVVDTPVSLVDVMPTVLELLGVPSPDGVDGTSLVGAMTDHTLEQRGSIYGWLCNQRRKRNCLAMQHSGLGTLIHGFQPFRIEFYGQRDFGQRKDLARSAAWPREQQLTLLGEHLDSGWTAHRGLGRRRGLEVDENTLERLRALGYAD